MRKVLVIAYRFPPQGGGGVQRSLKFVRYLPRFGWLPVVHTASNPYWPLHDETLLAEIPLNVRVYRTRVFEFERLEARLRGRIGGNSRPSAPRSSGIEPEAANGSRRTGLSRWRDVVHRRLLIPDPQIAWIPAALAKSLYIARREGVDAIYTSSPPNSSQVLGLMLKRVLRKPWVADFRDPWTEGVRRKQSYIDNPIRQRLEESWEHGVAERVDHLVVSTDANREQLVTKYPFLASKLTVLTNGFDPADFSHLSQKKVLRDDEFNLTLTGNVETMFDATPFFQAIKELLAENEAMRDSFRVNFIGTRRGKYDAYIQANGLERYIRYVGYVPHQQSIQYLAESDVLFLCQIPVYESAGAKLPGKLFEYLYMRKPVLALTIPGVTTEILGRAGLGVVVDPGAVAEIKQELQRLHGQWRAGRWEQVPDDAVIREFDRVRLTERLATILNQVRA